MSTSFPKIASLKSEEAFLEHINSLGIELPFSSRFTGTNHNPFAQAHRMRDRTVNNRFCILPMEGWDGTESGHPTDYTFRRWRNFGASGAAFIWGGEAFAVRHDGRANPNQLMLNPETVSSIGDLRNELVSSHRERFGEKSADELLIGLQLTHSGRFARPNDKQKLEPKTIYAHPFLDRKFSVPEGAILSDDDLKRLIDDFIAAAVLARSAGFDFVDVKHCHGYLGHELLSGFQREGEFGGSFENRTRFLREIVAGIHARAPGLMIGVRLSVFDFVPFVTGEDETGIPDEFSVAESGVRPWGADATGLGIDLSEPAQFLELCGSLGIELICTTAGSPYYVPHIQRPAAFPPSDGYLPPEDPLVGVARQINVSRELKKRFPDLTFVGSGYSYLQDWLAHVGCGAVEQNAVDFVGLGRIALSYPDLPADVLAGKTIARKKICRTFSDCTTAARHGMISGCFPLDPFYKALPEYKQLLTIKKEAVPGRNSRKPG